MLEVWLLWLDADALLTPLIYLVQGLFLGAVVVNGITNEGMVADDIIY